jgi:hypothetical protein
MIRPPGILLVAVAASLAKGAPTNPAPTDGPTAVYPPCESVRDHSTQNFNGMTVQDATRHPWNCAG